MTPYAELLKQATPLPLELVRRNDSVGARVLLCHGTEIAEVYHAPTGKLIEHSTNVLTQALEALKKLHGEILSRFASYEDMSHPLQDVMLEADKAIAAIENPKRGV